MSQKPRISIPGSAKKGDEIVVKTLISHPMETGRRKDEAGNTIPRQIINKFIVNFNGKEVFSVDLDTSVSADPYFSFPLKATESGTLEFIWIDDNGAKISDTKEIKVN